MGCQSSAEGSSVEGGNAKSDKVSVSPSTPIKDVFTQISLHCGIEDTSVSSKYVDKLNNLWYYRSYDLTNVSKEIWDELSMPIILKTEMFNFIEKCRNNEEYINYDKTPPKEKNIMHILNDLEANNASESTSNQIKTLKETLETLYCVNIDIMKLHLDESVWNEIDIPQYLKRIILRKIGHNFEGEMDHLLHGQKGENSELYPDAKQVEDDMKRATDRGDKEKEEKYEIEPQSTMFVICKVLSNKLYTEHERIRNDLSPIFVYNYNRIYHVSTISDDVYNELLSETPECLKDALYDIITMVRSYDIDPLPFYDYNININKTKKRRKSVKNKLEQIYIDGVMTTDKAFEILENDMNLEKGTLSEDCDLLMNHFYSNVWDWFFIPNEFWKQLPNYNLFEIIRIRVHDLMNDYAQKYNINNDKSMPSIPDLWLRKYDANLSMSQVLFGGNKNEFAFDGVYWNEITKNKIKLIGDYLTKNYVGKLQFLAREHIENSEVWSKYMTQHQIPHHIRFKINFYCIRGNIQTEDEWLNQYIKTYYPSFPPQYQQIIPHIGIKDIARNTVRINVDYEEKDAVMYGIKYRVKTDKNNDAEYVEFKESEYCLEGLEFDAEYTIECRARISQKIWSPFSKSVEFYIGPFVPHFEVKDITRNTVRIKVDFEEKVNALMYGIKYRVKRGHNDDVYKDDDAYYVEFKESEYCLKELEFDAEYVINCRVKLSQKIWSPYSQSVMAQIGSLFESNILNNKEEERILETLIKPHILRATNKKNMNIKLIYRNSRDGGSGTAFHSKCNGIANTIILIHSKFGNVFGGFTTYKWGSNSGNGNKDNDSFLFLIRSTFGHTPRIYKNIKKDNYAVCDFSNYGPWFGNGPCICLQCVNNSTHGSSLGYDYSTFEGKGNELCGGDSYNTAPGTYSFDLVEYEVFAVL